jgi:hypothetical protein
MSTYLHYPLLWSVPVIVLLFSLGAPLCSIFVSLLQEEATFLAAENSEVSPVEFLVAVAVIVCPGATLLSGEKVKVALPSAPVVTLRWPINFLPSLPEGLEKN